MEGVLTVQDLLTWLRRHGMLVGLCALAGAIGGVLVTSLLPREYRADVVVMLLREDGSAEGLASQFGGLAALAGVAIGNGSTDEALEVLRSRSLAAKFIEQNGLVPQLFPGRFDTAAGKWRKAEPTQAEAIEQFERSVRSVSQDKLTGMVRLSMRARDPELAARWANGIVELANAEMRARAAREAREMLGYLRTEASKSSVVEVRQSLYRLAEGQMKTLSMANVRREFAYRVIDPAIAPDTRAYVSPSRVAFGALGLLAGLFAGLGAAALRDGRRRTAT
jgi:uncharacterized protein involved in exopolysaccharide biosynthesis